MSTCKTVQIFATGKGYLQSTKCVQKRNFVRPRKAVNIETTAVPYSLGEGFKMVS